jgi:MoxR-like ATPase
MTEDDATVSPWRGTTPELLTAAAGVLAVAVAGYALAGWAGLTVVERVEVTPDLLDYIVAIVSATRRDAQVQIGASPRGGLALVQLARGQALLANRDYVIPDDIKQVAVPALAHRVMLRPELWVRQVSSNEVMTKLLAAVPTPKTDPARPVAG